MVKSLKKLNKIKVASLLGGLLILIGTTLLSTIMYFHYFDKSSAAASASSPTQIASQETAIQKAEHNKSLVTGFPALISIPGPRADLDMNVSVIPGYYYKQSDTWTLRESSAMFATTSTQPNNLTGNTFIYGHYRPNVFAYMHLITPGTLATITTNNGYKFSYRYIKTYAVKPDQTSVLSYSLSPILTIQTCSGTFFQNRQIFVFNYVSYSKV